MGRVGRGRGVSRLLIGGLLMLGSVSSISVVDLHTDLLGEGQLNSLAGRGSQTSHTLLSSLSDILNLGDSDALLFGDVLTGDPGQADGLVDAGLDGLGVGDINGGLNNGDNGDVVAGLLGDLLAVVVSVPLVSVSVSSGLGLADSDHLGLALLVEGNLNGLGGGGLSLGLVGVGADLVVDLLDGLSADGPGDRVALLLANHILPGQLNWVAGGLKGRGAHISSLNNILDSAVMLGVLISMAISRGVVTISWSWVAIRWSWVAISRGRLVWLVLLGGDTSGQGDEDKERENLKLL